MNLEFEVINEIIKKEIQRIKDQYHLSVEDTEKLREWTQSNIEEDTKDLSLDEVEEIAEIIKKEIDILFLYI